MDNILTNAKEDNSYKEHCLMVRREWYLKHKNRLRLSSRFGAVINRKYVNEYILNILGCSIQKYRDYLESKFKPGMNWNNHKFKGWHIDHIIPVCAFDLTKENEIRRCFHYTNTQPLWWWENIKKKRIPRKDMIN